MLDLSIIIVSYNTKKLLNDCLKSVFKNTSDVSYEVIVVDNASIDESADFLNNFKRLHKNLKVIINKKNFGFGGANNQGIKMAKGRFILLLNSDTLTHDNVLGEMVAWMKGNRRVGVATCALKNVDESPQATGGYFPTIFRVFSWMLFLDDLPFLGKIIKSFHPHTPDYFGNNQSYSKPHQCDWVTGAFMLLRKKALENSGIFDPDYFMYTEEVDLCFRIKNYGWQIWYLPDWKITHLQAASGSKEGALLGEFKGIKIFYKKHYPKWQFPILRFFLKTGSLLRMVLFGLLRGKEGFSTYAKAFQIA